MEKIDKRSRWTQEVIS